MEQVNRKLMNWASILEDGARQQALNTASMRFVHPHLALMPDAHWGMGATVGSVIPTLGAIIPAAVGVDIGCGMLAVRTQFTTDAFTDRAVSRRGTSKALLHGAITAVIPMSAGHYNDYVYDDQTHLRIRELEERRGSESASDIAPNWRLQLGSLGSGNHFIEVTADELGRIWLFLHSGSRGVGNKLAMKHIKAAKRLCDRWWIDLPDPDLAYLAEGGPEFTAYIRDLHWAQHFALLNRAEMMHRVADVVSAWAGEPVQEEEVIACHHNYTAREHHFGRDVWLSRKGAIDASEGKRGLIPGSMGAASYVVTGKGNRLSLNSAPHGAGRNYSRAAARRAFTRAQLDAAMTGITWGNSDEFLDEIPAAYKDIGVVMADAADLVTVDHELHQLVNVKGN